MNIHLHIDHLVLDGVSLAPHQHEAFRASVNMELARLLTAHGLASDLAAGSARPLLAGRALQLRAGTGPQRLGVDVGRSIYAAFGAPGSNDPRGSERP